MTRMRWKSHHRLRSSQQILVDFQELARSARQETRKEGLEMRLQLKTRRTMTHLKMMCSLRRYDRSLHDLCARKIPHGEASGSRSQQLRYMQRA
jgi:hypothetical protein